MNAINSDDLRKILKNDNPTSLDKLSELIALHHSIIISRPTLQKLLNENNLSLTKTWISDQELIDRTQEMVTSLGGYYGRKTIKGALASNGYNASQRRIGNALRTINPETQIQRALNTHRQLNPRRYRAPHFGYNLHIDQNEKLVDYGCVVVMAVDGSSNFLVAGFTSLN